MVSRPTIIHPRVPKLQLQQPMKEVLLMIKICEQCHKEFETKNGHNNQRFCSKSCAVSSRFEEDKGLFRDDVEDYIQKYILGLIITDGCITKNGKKFVICISLKDKEMIEQIRDIVCETKKVYKDGNNYQVKWRNSNDISYLEELKITQRKTYTVGVPHFEHNMNHLIRGIFDGDGSVYNSTTTNKGNRYTYKYLSFTSGSEQFVNDLSDFLTNNDIKFKVTLDNRRKDCTNKTYYIKIQRKEDVQKLKSLMYKDCKEWKLKRKYDLLQL